MDDHTFGAAVSAPDLEGFLTDVLVPNYGMGGMMPVCIWGNHGIGKTEIVRAFAQKNKWQYQEIAPAQFEEMGDFLGMPTIENGYTKLKPPRWVPSSKGPGILMLDDFNRADDRILRGLMPLLQDGQLVSWVLPDQWRIVLTANPDSGDYSVTPLDDAILTRMIHITLTFDVQAWLSWAGTSGLDYRGIAFVARYPELVTGKRTTPRTLEQFIRLAAGIPDWKRGRKQLQHMAEACLDPETVGGLLDFVRAGGAGFPGPESILLQGDFNPIRDHDSISVWPVLEGVLRYLERQKGPPSSQELNNLKKLILLDVVTKDQCLAVAQRLIRCRKPYFNTFLSDTEIGAKML